MTFHRKLLVITLLMRSFLDAVAIDSLVILDVPLEEKNIRLGELFDCSFGCKVKFEDIWEKTLSDIKANEEGRKLLARLETLSCHLFKLQEIFQIKWDGKIHITACESGTCFAGRKFAPEQRTVFGLEPEKSMSLFLNLDLTSKSVAWHKTEGLCSIIPAIFKKHDKPFFEIETCADPYWLTVAHEFIHMEHFLMQEMNEYVCRYVFYNTLKEILAPELKEQLKDEIIESLEKELGRKVKRSDTGKINERIDAAIEKICSCKEGLVANFPKLESKIWEKISTLKGICSNDSSIDVLSRLFEVSDLQESIVEYYDFLNSPQRLHARYEQNKNISKWNDIETEENRFLLETCPELASRISSRGSLSFWENLEERETVIGSKCSELVLRLSEEKIQGKLLPIRYLYQDLQTFFVEDKTVLLQIINAARKTLRMTLLSSSSMDTETTDERLKSFFNQSDFSRIITSMSILSDSVRKKYFPNYWHILVTSSKWLNQSEFIRCTCDESTKKLRKEFRIALLADETNKENVERLESSLRNGEVPDSSVIRSIIVALEEIVKK